MTEPSNNEGLPSFPPKPPEIEHVMTKKSRSASFIQNWKLRWFKISEGIIEYWDVDGERNEKKGSKEQGKMRLRDAVVENLNEEGKEIFIYTPHEHNLYMKATSEATASQWKEVVTQHCEYLKLKKWREDIDNGENGDEDDYKEHLKMYLNTYHEDIIQEREREAAERDRAAYEMTIQRAAEAADRAAEAADRLHAAHTAHTAPLSLRPLDPHVTFAGQVEEIDEDDGGRHMRSMSPHNDSSSNAKPMRRATGKFQPIATDTGTHERQYMPREDAIHTTTTAAQSQLQMEHNLYPTNAQSSPQQITVNDVFHDKIMAAKSSQIIMNSINTQPNSNGTGNVHVNTSSHQNYPSTQGIRPIPGGTVRKMSTIAGKKVDIDVYRARKVVPYVCLLEIHAKLIQSRKSPPSLDSKHLIDEHFLVRSRREMEDTSVWLLTNYGWVEEKAVGNANRRKPVAILSQDVQPDHDYMPEHTQGNSTERLKVNLHPISMKVLKTQFQDLVVKGGWFTSSKNTFETAFVLEFEYEHVYINRQPPTSSCVYVSSDECDVAKQIFNVQVKEKPVMRICRTYAELVALEHEINIHHSVLGENCEFPTDMIDGCDELMENPEELINAQDAIQRWFNGVLKQVSINDTHVLSEFLIPTYEDKDRIVADLSSKGGLDNDWADIADLMMSE